MDISIIIPAYNEEKLLGETLRYIVESIPENMLYEIIVVDNNSTDNTQNIAQNYHARIISIDSGTIAKLRNCGASASSGDILIFLDADILLTKQWQQNFPGVFCQLQENPYLLTGSWVGISKKPSWLEKNWFEPLCRGSVTHMNSAHLIISRKLFNELNGFNEALETGEDYDISVRAVQHGAKLENNPSLFVHHEGYPRTIKKFFNREVWHGKGDFYSLKTFISSKVAVLSVITLLLSILFLFNLIFIHSSAVAGSSVMLIAALCLISSYMKYGSSSLPRLIINTFIYYIYFIARSLSLYKAILIKQSKRTRS